MKYYLIIGNNLVGTIDETAIGTIALPLIRTGDAMSLLNEQHAINLMTNLSLTSIQALAALGLVDLRSSAIKSIIFAPQVVGLQTRVDGAAYKLIDIGAFSLYQVDAPVANLLAIHAELWAKAPAQTLGILAVVQTFGDTFASSAVRTATGMTIAQALARRDRVASYLESLGKNAAALRAATTEHTQMAGIVTALGYTMAQLWETMVE